MKFKLIIAITGALVFSASAHAAKSNNAESLMKQMSKTVGSMKKLKKLKDVQYTYIYRDNASGKSDISTEKYIFDGEISWAQYDTHEKHVFPKSTGTVVQFFNGKETWTTLNGEKIEDPQALKLADFLRKTNFYWFSMFQKLMDPGVIFTYDGTQKVGEIEYDLIKVGFGEGVGDAQDTYVLYLNPETKLVDQFLFTVMDFGMKDPFLMKVEYKDYHGIKLPFRRRYAPSNWKGEILKDEWVDEIMNDIKFKNGFTVDMFQP